MELDSSGVAAEEHGFEVLDASDHDARMEDARRGRMRRGLQTHAPRPRPHSNRVPLADPLPPLLLASRRDRDDPPLPHRAGVLERAVIPIAPTRQKRSEEHTSELQS